MVDARLSRSLGHGLAAELTATNLFATRYEEFDGIPMPGRWVVLGLPGRVGEAEAYRHVPT